MSEPKPDALERLRKLLNINGASVPGGLSANPIECVIACAEVLEEARRKHREKARTLSERGCVYLAFEESSRAFEDEHQATRLRSVLKEKP